MPNVMEEIQTIHDRLCDILNIDQSSAERSWEAYKSICVNYRLEGDVKHWLCCSIYVVCRESVTPAVDNTIVEGNCVSLTRLLRICEISIYQFFQKIWEWIGMASVPTAFRLKIEGLKSRFAVSASVFQKYLTIFKELFNQVIQDETKRSRKSKPMPCTSKKTFEFGWTLFICVMSEQAKEKNVDLVLSYHLLLCCLDLLFSNAVIDNRHDLILEWRNDKYNSKSVDDLCKIDELCERFDGEAVDAREVKVYTWIPLIKRYINKNVLKGDIDTLSDIISIANFEDNLKSLNNYYEINLLLCGEFDERIFLGSSECLGETIEKSLVTNTPLTSANLKPSVKLTPVQSATQSLAQLRHKLKGYGGNVQAGLRELINKPDLLMERLAKMRKILDEQVSSSTGPDRFQLTEGLYFFLLENIIRNEIKMRPHVAVKNYIEDDIFQKTLITCCIEIILFSYNNSTKKFPWVLQCFNLHAIDFNKIIEPVISNGQDIFTRAIVKHLASIEEEIYESLAWTSNSPLWARIYDYGKILPTCADVDMPRTINGDLSGIAPHTPNPSNETESQEMLGQESTSNGSEPRSPNIDNSINATRCEIINNGNNRQNIIVPRPGGSLRLFLRKFYKLAHLRMDLLCKGLELNDADVLRKIWTLFEHSVVQYPELLKDRHLDQILMCAIYVLNRVAHLEKTFTDIMKFYRTQPQAASHVYRSVFFWVKGSSDDYSNNKETIANSNDSASAPAPARPAPPGSLAGTSVIHRNEERGDIIEFYNKIYVPKVGEYAKQFQNIQSTTLLLSPLPTKGTPRNIPKKISNNCSIYVTKLDRKLETETKGSITYQFGSSPAKDLQMINLSINRDTPNPSKKRIFAVAGSASEPSLKSSRLICMMSDRQEQSDNE